MVLLPGQMGQPGGLVPTSATPIQPKGSLAGNFFRGMRDFATGLPAGLFHLGKTAVMDPLHAVSGGAIGDEFRSDDIAKGLYSYYKDEAPWLPLATGDFGEAWDRFHANPFDASFDLATLGYGAAGKLGKAGSFKNVAPNSHVVTGSKTGLSWGKTLKPHHNPVYRLAQQNINKLRGSKHLDDTRFGTEATAQKWMNRDLRRITETDTRAIASPFMRAEAGVRALADDAGSTRELADQAMYARTTGATSARELSGWFEDFLSHRSFNELNDTIYKIDDQLRELHDAFGNSSDAARLDIRSRLRTKADGADATPRAGAINELRGDYNEALYGSRKPGIRDVQQKIARKSEDAWSDSMSANELRAEAERVIGRYNTGERLEDYLSEFGYVDDTAASHWLDEAGYDPATYLAKLEAAVQSRAGLMDLMENKHAGGAGAWASSQFEDLLDQAVEFVRHGNEPRITGVMEHNYPGMRGSDLVEWLGDRGISRQTLDDMADVKSGKAEATYAAADSEIGMLKAKRSELLERSNLMFNILADEDALLGLEQRWAFLHNNDDALRQLWDTDEMNVFHSEARKLGSAGEDAYVDAMRSKHARRGNALDDGVEHFDEVLDEAGEFDEAALRAEMTKNRVGEYELLKGIFPDPDGSVAGNAVFTSHKRPIAEGAAKGRGFTNAVGKSTVKPDAMKHRTGRGFLTGQTRWDPDVMLDSFFSLREANITNQVIESTAARFADDFVMTRREFEMLPDADDWVKLSYDKAGDVGPATPKQNARFQASANALREMKAANPSLADNVTDAADLYDALADAPKFLESINDSIGTAAAGGVKQADEMVIAVPKAVFDSMKRDAHHAESALLKAFDVGTDYWRTMVLSMRAPQWMLNNAVGQAMLASVQGGPVGTAKRIYQIYRKNGSDLRNAIEDVAGPVKSSGTSAAHFHAKSAGSKPITRFKDIRAVGKRGPTDSFLLRLSDWINAKNAAGADDPFRSAEFIRNIENLDEFKALRAGGLDDAGALRQLAKDNPIALDGAIQETLGNMVDFRAMSPFERRVMRRIFPFWSWMRGSTVAAGRILRDKPLTAFAGGQVSRVGLSENEHAFGQEVPTFLQGSIPIKDGMMLSTAAFNPFQTPTDLLGGVAQYMPGGPAESYGGESLVAQMNPMVKGPLAAMTGTDPFWGSDLKGRPVHALLPKWTADNRFEYALNQGASIPQTKLLADTFSAAGWGPYAKPRSMYNTRWWQPGFQFATGLPIKTPKMALAAQRARQERMEDMGVSLQ